MANAAILNDSASATAKKSMPLARSISGSSVNIRLSSRAARVNQVFGPGVFEDLDELMKEAIDNDADHICPSL